MYRLKGNRIFKGKRVVGELHRGKFGWFIYHRLEGHMYGPYELPAGAIRDVFKVPPEQVIQFPELSNEPRGF